MISHPLVQGVVIVASATLAAQSARIPTAADWQSDLRFLQTELPRRHPAPFRHISQREFDGAIADLQSRFGSLTDHERIIELARLVARVGDGHTGLYPGEQTVAKFTELPLTLYQFEEGLFVIAAPVPIRHVVGRRLVRIDATPIDVASTTIATIIPADNEAEYAYSVPAMLTRLEVLHALRISRRPGAATFVFSGEPEVSVVFEEGGVTKLESASWTPVRRELGDAIPAPSLNSLFAPAWDVERPLRTRWYTFHALPQSQAVYLKYNRCFDQDGAPRFQEIASEVLRILDANPTYRLVVDVRQNPGGEPKTASPLVDELASRRAFADRGRPVVLIGRRTFSAAATNTAELRRRANALLIGERSRAKPNNPSEGRELLLPRTGVKLWVSTQTVTRDPALGDARYFPLDVTVPLTFADYARSNDAALERALSHGRQ